MLLVRSDLPSAFWPQVAIYISPHRVQQTDRGLVVVGASVEVSMTCRRPAQQQHPAVLSHGQRDVMACSFLLRLPSWMHRYFLPCPGHATPPAPSPHPPPP